MATELCAKTSAYTCSCSRMEAEEHVRAAVCRPRAYLTTKWNGNIGIRVSYFFRHSISIDVRCISTKHFDIINISNWNRCSCRWTPLSYFILCLYTSSSWLCSVFFFSNLHSFTHVPFCAFSRIRFVFLFSFCSFFLPVFNTLSTHKHFKCGHYKLPLQISNFFRCFSRAPN